MRTILASIFLAGASISLLAQDPVQEVLAVKQKVGAAMRTKDISVFEKAWSPDVKFNSPNNTIDDRTTVIHLIQDGRIQSKAYKEVIESTSVFRDVVVLMGHEELTSAVGPDAGIPRIRRFTDVWQRNSEGSWVLIARQANFVDGATAK
jgi:ketosteroid isomerase-like protein